MKIFVKIIEGLGFLGIFTVSLVFKDGTLFDRLSLAIIFGIIILLCVCIDWELRKANKNKLWR